QYCGIGRLAFRSAADGVIVTSMPAPHAGPNGFVAVLRLMVSVAGAPMPSMFKGPPICANCDPLSGIHIFTLPGLMLSTMPKPLRHTSMIATLTSNRLAHEVVTNFGAVNWNGTLPGV